MNQQRVIDVEVYVEGSRRERRRSERAGSRDDLRLVLWRENPDFKTGPPGTPHMDGVEWAAPAVEAFAVYVGAKAAERGIDVVTNEIVDRIVGSVISWARLALQHEKDVHQARGWRRLFGLGRRTRSKHIIIYGPNREVLRSVLVRETDSDPEISDPEISVHSPRA